jgi:hypothetical protein
MTMTAHLVRTRKSLFPRLGDVFVGLVGPQSGTIPATFANVCPDAELHETLIGDIQRFRGRVYFADGTIPATALDEQGRHHSAVDHDSWHVILLDRRAGMCGCLRAILHTDCRRLSKLHMRDTITRLGERADRYAGAIDAFLVDTSRLGRGVLEAGGWAVREDCRNSTTVPILALACWSLGQLLGGCLMVGTAGRCNQSAAILRRLGGIPFADGRGPLPVFYDHHHRCEIEVLRFDSHHPAEEYQPTVLEVREFLRNALVVVPSGTPAVYPARPGRELVNRVETPGRLDATLLCKRC